MHTEATRQEKTEDEAALSELHFGGHVMRGTAEFVRRLIETDPSKVITISCVDYREIERTSYLFTSAGNVVHPQLVDDLHLILNGKEILILRCHTDCAKSKAEVPREEFESAESYAARVEARTIERLWREARVLLNDSAVKEALAKGLLFCAERFDVKTGAITCYEAESMALIEEVLGAREYHEREVLAA